MEPKSRTLNETGQDTHAVGDPITDVSCVFISRNKITIHVRTFIEMTQWEDECLHVKSYTSSHVS